MRGPNNFEQPSSNAASTQNDYGLYQMNEQPEVVPQGNYNGNNRNAYYPGGEIDHSAYILSQYQQVPADHQTPPTPVTGYVEEDSNPFAEYAWMVDEDEFEKQVLEQMEQEEYFENKFRDELMWLEDEDNGEWYIPPQGGANQVNPVEKLTLTEPAATTSSFPRITLNPNAAEFKPRTMVQH